MKKGNFQSIVIAFGLLILSSASFASDGCSPPDGPNCETLAPASGSQATTVVCENLDGSVTIYVCSSNPDPSGACAGPADDCGSVN
jgi:hypothetical protein